MPAKIPTAPRKRRRSPWWPLALAGAMALASEIVEWFGLAPDWVVAGLALLAILGAGLPTYRKGWIALKNRNLNINALMSIAVTGAVLIGQWPEAAMVSVLFAIAELIEAKSLIARATPSAACCNWLRNRPPCWSAANGRNCRPSKWNWKPPCA